AWFSIANFRYYAVRDDLPLRFMRAWDDEPLGVDYMILKTGDVGPPWTAERPRRIVARLAADRHLDAAFPVIGEFLLPDGSRATVRARRLPVVSGAADTLARALAGALRQRAADVARAVEGLEVAVGGRGAGVSGAGPHARARFRAASGPAGAAGARSRPVGRRPGAVPARRLGIGRDRSVARHRRAPAVSGRGRSDRDRTGRAPGGGIVKRETPVERKARARKIIRLLERAYPDASIALTFSDPLALLVATILSPHSTDERVNQVTPALFKKYRTA